MKKIIKKIVQKISAINSLSLTKKYVIAFFIYIIAVIARLSVLPISAGLGFITFYPAMEIAALFCGSYPCLFLVSLSSLTGFFLFGAPIVSLIIYINAGLIMSFIIYCMKNTHDELIQSNEDLKHSINSINELNSKLKETLNHKKIFMSTMSHELRTPLNAIIGFSEIMFNELFGELSPKYKEYSENINSAGNDLLELINDILIYRQLNDNDNNHNITPQLISINFIKEIINNIHIKNKTIIYNLNDSKIFIDYRSLKQIINNIISNCVKYGGDIISIKSYNIKNDVILEIHDNGIGIPENKIEKLYIPFYSDDSFLNKNSSGLGIPIVKKLIELNNGNIDIVNNYGTLIKLTFQDAN